MNVTTATTASATQNPPRPPGRLGRFIATHPRAIDISLASVLLAVWLLAIAQDVLGRPGDPGVNADGSYQLWLVIARYVLAVAACAALALRRARPVLVFAIVAFVGVITLPFGWAGATATVIAAYSLGAHQPDTAERASRVAQSAFAVLAVILMVIGIAVPHIGVGNALFLITIYFAVLALGISIRERRLYVSALVDHAAAVEREQEQSAQLAVADEREHIAREMHDVIAHGLTVMVRLADGAHSRLDGATGYADVTRAVEHIADTGRRSLADTRRMLSALGDDAARSPQPTLAQLPTLIDDFVHAGLPVTVQQSGTPPASAGVQLAVYRTVQEALTNVLKHAEQPTDVRVELDYAEGTTVTVTDDGKQDAARGADAGRGIRGMQQRAKIFGGDAQADSTDSGWTVRFRIPRQDGSTQ